MAAIVFAMVTVVLLAVAVRQWSAPPPEAGSDESARNRWHGTGMGRYGFRWVRFSVS